MSEKRATAREARRLVDAARSEADIQKAVVAWARAIAHRYPALSLLYAIPNERRVSRRRGKHMNDLGRRRGMPDLCLPVQTGRHGALYIEMKKPGGVVTRDQRETLARLVDHGNAVAVCYTVDEAIQTITEYLNLPMPARTASEAKTKR